MNLFDWDKPLLKIHKPVRLIELFAGIGAQAKALERLGVPFEHYRICEFDRFAVASYNAIHGTDFQASDITQITADDLGIVETDSYSAKCSMGRKTIMNESKLYQLEKRCPTCQFVLSDANGLAYATAPADERIVIFTDRQRIVLDRSQAYVLSKELPDLICMIGRGSVNCEQGRRRKRG